MDGACMEMRSIFQRLLMYYIPFHPAINHLSRLYLLAYVYFYACSIRFLIETNFDYDTIVAYGPSFTAHIFIGTTMLFSFQIKRFSIKMFHKLDRMRQIKSCRRNLRLYLTKVTAKYNMRFHVKVAVLLVCLITFLPLFKQGGKIHFFIYVIEQQNSSMFLLNQLPQIVFYAHLPHAALMLVVHALQLHYAASFLHTQISMLVHSLKGDFGEYNCKHGMKLMRSAQYQREIYVKLAGCVATHQTIAKTSQFISAEILSIAVPYLSAAILFIISCSFSLINVATSSNASKYNMLQLLLLVLSTAIIVLTFCSAGQMLMDLNEQFASALYCTPWYHWSPTNRKLVIFLLMNTSNSQQVRLGGIFQLNSTFALKIAKFTYNITMVLYKLINQKN